MSADDFYINPDAIEFYPFPDSEDPKEWGKLAALIAKSNIEEDKGE